MNDLEITDGEFFLLRTAEMDLVHDTRREAIENLKEYATPQFDASDAEISVVEVSIDGGDWTIAEIPWQEIALELLGGGE